MSGTVTHLKTRQRVNPEHIKPNAYLWWGKPDFSSGYPVQVMNVDFTAGTFTYVNLCLAQAEPDTCPLTYPHLHPVTESRVREFVANTVKDNAQGKSLRQILSRALTRLWDDLELYRENNLHARLYKRISKRRGLL